MGEDCASPSVEGSEGSRVIDVNLNITVELAGLILEDEAMADHIMRGIKDYIRRRLNGEIAPVIFQDIPDA